MFYQTILAAIAAWSLVLMIAAAVEMIHDIRDGDDQ